MKKTASDVLVQSLVDWGVEVVFGLPGDGINGIMEALRKRADTIRFIQVRHEESAAFMACGYAKYTGKLGVCLATSGPGGIHLLNGLRCAAGRAAGPAIRPAASTSSDAYATDVELDKLFMTSRCTTRDGSSSCENVTDCVLHGPSYRGPPHITIPVDMQDGGRSAAIAAKCLPTNCICTRIDTSARFRHRACRRGPELRQKSCDSCGSRRNRRSRRVGNRGGAAWCANRQSVARQRRRSGRQPIHHRRHRVARDQAVAGGARELRHPADGRHSFPYIEFLPRPGQARAVRSKPIPCASA